MSALKETIEGLRGEITTVRFNTKEGTIDFVTKTGLELAPSAKEYRDAAVGVLDMDIQQKTAHVHGEMLAAPAAVNPQVAPEMVAQLDRLYTASPSMESASTIETQPAPSSPIQTIEIDPQEVNVQTIKTLQYMAEEGMLGAGGKENLAEALQALYSLRPDLAQEMGQAQQSARLSTAAQVNKSASVDNDFGQKAGNWMERIAQQHPDKSAQILR